MHGVREGGHEAGECVAGLRRELEHGYGYGDQLLRLPDSRKAHCGAVVCRGRGSVVELAQREDEATDKDRGYAAHVGMMSFVGKRGGVGK